jgi:NADH:ubiquinone oxidoreductase subunit 6 (subunit J)
MATINPESAAAETDRAAPRGSQRRWSAQIAASALAVQALVYLGAILYAVLIVDWTLPTEELLLRDDAYGAALTILVLGPVVVALLAAALLVLVRPPLGWTVAQVAETVLLLIGVQLYFTDVDQALLLPLALRDFLLLGAILVVVYLNSPEGRLLLVRRAAPAAVHG